MRRNARNGRRGAAPRRIVVNGRFLAQPCSGVQRYAVETLRALDRLLGREPEHLIATSWQLALPHDAGDPPLLDHFEIKMQQFLTGHLWEQVTLAAFARGAYLVNMGYSGPLRHRRQLITVHDAAVRAHPQSYTRAYRVASGRLTQWLAPRVDTLVTVSEFSADDITTRFALERDDIVVGRNGHEHALAGPADARADAALLERHGLKSGAFLLAVGSAKASKNFAVLPRALALVDPALRTPLAVAGAPDTTIYDGGEFADGAGIVRLGFVDDATLYTLYRHAAWFVFPSLYEGFGLPAIEAMANGCPVIAARAAAIPEVCADAVLYFDPHEPGSLAERLRLVAGPDGPVLRAALRRRAATRLAIYRWDLNARILLDRLIAVGATAPATVADEPDTVPTAMSAWPAPLAGGGT